MIDLRHGDCLKIMPTIPDGSVDMILTDIPYNEVNKRKETKTPLRKLNKGKADSANFDLDVLIREFIRVCNGTIYVFCGFEQFSKIIDIYRDCGLSARCVVWKKKNPTPLMGQHLWVSGIELCAFGRKKNATFNRFCKNSVFEFSSGTSKIHPTQKPIKLFEELIEASSSEGKIVFDPFMGSGTTGVACKNLNRNFIGIEKDDKYFAIAQKRIYGTMPQEKLAI